MKTREQIKGELKELEADLRRWRLKYAQAAEGTASRQIAANTVCGLEAQLEALDWVLED